MTQFLIGYAVGIWLLGLFVVDVFVHPKRWELVFFLLLPIVVPLMAINGFAYALRKRAKHWWLVLLFASLSLFTPALPTNAASEDLWIIGLRSNAVPHSINAIHTIPQLHVAVVRGEKPAGDFRYVHRSRPAHIAHQPPDLPPFLWHHPLMHRDEGLALAGPYPIRVAVIDTGINTHPELIGYDNRIHCSSYLEDAPCNGSVGDDAGHGTHVAGSIAGQTFGLAPGIVQLRARKVCDEHGRCDDFAVAEAVADAVDAGAQILNLSLGRPGIATTDVLCDAVRYAWERGVWVVAAAGNSSHAVPHLPAGCEGAMAVTATNWGDWLWWMSNKCGEQRRCYGAPGKQIDSIGGLKTGTSMAAPQLAGVIALMLSRNPSASVDEILPGNVVDLGDEGWDVNFGHGRIDAEMAAEAVEMAWPAGWGKRTWLPLVRR